MSERTRGTRPPGKQAAERAAAARRAVIELEKYAQVSKQLTREDVALHRPTVATMLRRTAEIAKEVAGDIPTPWTHYISARRAFRSDAELAEALGVNRSRVARWKQGEASDPRNEERLRNLDIVVSLLSGYLDERAIPDWLQGANPHLRGRRPIDVLKAGRLSEVVAAIEAEKSGAFA